MTTFIVLYRGSTIADARIIAVSADADLTAFVATELLASPRISNGNSDPVLNAMNEGKVQALNLIAKGSLDFVLITDEEGEGDDAL